MRLHIAQPRRCLLVCRRRRCALCASGRRSRNVRRSQPVRHINIWRRRSGGGAIKPAGASIVRRGIRAGYIAQPVGDIRASQRRRRTRTIRSAQPVGYAARVARASLIGWRVERSGGDITQPIGDIGGGHRLGRRRGIAGPISQNRPVIVGGVRGICQPVGGQRIKRHLRGRRGGRRIRQRLALQIARVHIAQPVRDTALRIDHLRHRAAGHLRVCWIRLLSNATQPVGRADRHPDPRGRRGGRRLGFGFRRISGRGASGSDWLNRRHITQPVGRIINIATRRPARKVGDTGGRSTDLAL